MTITHQLEINAPLSEVYEMLSSLGGLRSWWTTDIHGDPEKGGELKFGFGDGLSNVVRVTDARKNKWIIWTITSSTFPHKGDWVATALSIRLVEGGNRQTNVVFEHENNADMKNLCGTQWDASMKSLKQACETGKGSPLNPKRTFVAKV